MPHARRPQPGPVRLAHWANVPLLVILAASGLQILAAYPMMGPQGAPYGWYPFQGDPPRVTRAAGGSSPGARGCSWDGPSAFHPQTILAYGMNGEPLPPEHGAPLRLYSGVKLGYKRVKYLTAVNFLPEPTGGYWEDRGYEWFAGV